MSKLSIPKNLYTLTFAIREEIFAVAIFLNKFNYFRCYYAVTTTCTACVWVSMTAVCHVTPDNSDSIFKIRKYRKINGISTSMNVI